MKFIQTHETDVADLSALKSLLANNNIELDEWGSGTAKSIENLWEELAAGEISLKDAPFRRVLRGVVQLIIRRGDHILVEAEQVFADGRTRRRGIPPAEKMRPGESYVETALRCLKEELEIDPQDAVILTHTHTTWREYRHSVSYPGLLGQYTIHRVEVRIDGLPQENFWTCEADDAHESIVSRHHWVWTREELSRGKLASSSKEYKRAG